MFSLVICSIDPAYLSAITENIKTTIGAAFELLIWDNRDAGKGLTEVYNKMAARASYPYLCFLHEDILFACQNWGPVLENLFSSDPDLGMIGVAGGRYKSSAYSGWYSGLPGMDFFNITHRINGKDDKMIQPDKSARGPHAVVCLDGVFLACRQEVWEEIRFNEELLKGFHFYDIDFSLRASMKYKVGVTLEIDLIHITRGGDYGDNWIREAIGYHEGLRGMLPRCLDERTGKSVQADASGKKIRQQERDVARHWLDWLKIHRISFPYRLKWLTRQGLVRSPRLWYAIVKFLFYRPMGLRRIHIKALRRPPKIS
jgi:hypothetical protein